MWNVFYNIFRDFEALFITKIIAIIDIAVINVNPDTPPTSGDEPLVVVVCVVVVVDVVIMVGMVVVVGSIIIVSQMVTVPAFPAASIACNVKL